MTDDAQLPRREFLLTLPRRRLAAGLLLRDGQGRVCLVVPTYKPNKILPGGTVETGESPAEATAREVVEELGLDLPVGRLLVIDEVKPDQDDDHGAMILGYDGGVLTDEQISAIGWPEDELSGVVFVHPDDLDQHCTPANAARVRAALAALADGTVAELGR
ncbi:NUDIX domain-containing protein [Aestuariimicrobium ganziense]|uniref:NUDIX domain-containing protein n=1 Tax=Aestuariimicrobium ganziense TaxID=2773677 RepID=UPI001940EB40|nr:NUDIX hydrolase [Aestuariimicrobium ganziense]